MAGGAAIVAYCLRDVMQTLAAFLPGAGALRPRSYLVLQEANFI
jgi:hypothetical protein